MKRIVILLAVLFTGASGFAQKMDAAAVAQLVASKNFRFVAQTVFPLGGSARNITGEYELQVKPDSLVTFLPYFGRAYVATIPPEGGINFTSTSFTYSVAKKKSGWNITIIPKDAKDVRQMNLNVSSSGYGNLQVTSANRQAISYAGYIREK